MVITNFQIYQKYLNTFLIKKMKMTLGEEIRNLDAANSVLDIRYDSLLNGNLKDKL